MPNQPTYDRVNTAFEKAVVQLQENLQYIVNQGKVSDKFISMQNHIIKSLIDYQHETEDLRGHLEWDNFQLAKGKVAEIERLKEVKESFEAVCLIHGIIDFPVWMNKGNDYLVEEAVKLHKAGEMFLPSTFKDYINDLPTGEQKIIKKILNKKHDAQIAELDKRITELKQKRHDDLRT